MEIIMIFVSGILTAISVYLVLSKSLIRIVMGTTLLTHAANLFLITMGGLKHGTVPIYEANVKSYVDPASTYFNSNRYRLCDNSLFLSISI